jgi:hypothetical protein
MELNGIERACTSLWRGLILLIYREKFRTRPDRLIAFVRGIENVSKPDQSSQPFSHDELIIGPEPSP